jgi:hypothetical protein
MAAPDKRSIGCAGNWIGGFVNAFTGHVLIPFDKVLRVQQILGDAISHIAVTFKKWCKCVGLLEHVRVVLGEISTVMYGFYAPHKHSAGPDTRIRATEELLTSARGWGALLTARPRCACSTVALHLPLVRIAPPPSGTIPSESRFFLYTDTALKDRGYTGFGGWLHGFFFTMRIPDDLQGYPIV